MCDIRVLVTGNDDSGKRRERDRTRHDVHPEAHENVLKGPVVAAVVPLPRLGGVTGLVGRTPFVPRLDVRERRVHRDAPAQPELDPACVGMRLGRILSAFPGHPIAEPVPMAVRARVLIAAGDAAFAGWREERLCECSRGDDGQGDAGQHCRYETSRAEELS